MRRNSQRGSALVIAIIVVMIMAVIGVAMLRFGARELAGATAMKRQQALSACADAGRQLILSQFHVLGPAPTSLAGIDDAIDPSTGARVVAGHYDSLGSSVEQVTILPATAFGVDRGGTMSIGNRIFVTNPKPTKVVVHCQIGGTAADPTSGTQLEVEFGLRFGI